MASQQSALIPPRPAAAQRTPGTQSSRLRRRAADATVWYLRVIAVLNIVAVLSLPFRQEVYEHNNGRITLHLHRQHAHHSGQFFTPYLATAGLISAALAIFFVLVMRRRKRAAWAANLALSAPLFVLYVLALTQPEYRTHAFNWLSAALTGLFVAALLISRREFHAVGDPSNPKLALAVGVGGLVVTGGLGTLLVHATNTIPGATLADEVGYTLLRGVSVGPLADRVSTVHAPRWTDIIINILLAAAFCLVLYALFRSPRGRRLLGPEDEERLHALLDKHGARDSLGYFALRRDKAAIFSPTGKAAVTYRVVGGVSLASGDPIGDPEAWPGAIDAWLTEARQHAWTPAVMGASEEAGTIYGRHGLDALELGDEAIVDIADFTLEGRAMRVVRQAHNRVRRAGYTVRIRRHEDIPADEMALLIDRADHWRDGATERGFSMALGRLGDPSDGRCVMLECRDADDVPRALLSFVPWGEHGLSLDLMRRDRACENGLMEFMVVELLLRAAELDIRRVSLNFAMFRSVFERGSRLGAGPVLRLWHATLTFFSRWWQIESLYRANAKYRPIWEPRYLLFARSSDIPRIGLASARAEGFLTLPWKT
ncbi:phosphatidylglycerol lysyltransferase domain-containing protein [Streptomyces sp. NPDC002766]|uniref:phosphatidylglycerol lysyltransferase domain-containing protein n=1 Tax=Streptomyces sp. NPDC002766 TaxID=3154429 RepID=UPI0033317D70